MHIAFLTSEYPHEKIKFAAGIGTSIKNLVTELLNEKIQVSVFVYGQQTDEIIIENGIKIHLIKSRKYTFFTWFFYRKHIQNYLNQFVVSDKIDIIEAPDWTGITAFMRLKAPLIIRFHGSDAYFCHLEKRKQKLKNFIFEKLAINKAVAFIAPTNYAGNVSKYIFRIKNKPIQTIHYGLSLTQFENELPLHFEKGMILYIGTIIRKKGVLELPSILKKVVLEYPDAHLIMIGNDSFDIQTQSTSTWQLLLNDLDENLKNKIKFIGKVPYKEVQEYIKKANVCVFPTFAETLGMVTIESMAMQKPVVNSNIGWSLELIEDQVSGYLVHPQNHNLFAERIIQIIKDDNLYNFIGKNARERVEKKFDIKRTVMQNIDFYNNLIKKN